MLTKAQVRQKWVEALRSGEYQQGKQKLQSLDNQFCCLGVLCELAVKEGVISPPVRYEDSEHSQTGYCYDGNRGMLPDAVQKWAGLKTNWGKFYDGRPSYNSLIDLNDDPNGGKSFSEIADVIESAPEGLFVPDDVNATESTSSDGA